MKKSVKKNYIYNLVYQVVAIVVPVVVTPYVSRVLGPKSIGIYDFTLSISAYFILFGSLGIALYGQREIAYVQNNRKQYSKRFYEIFLLRCITMLISMIVFYIFFVKGNNNYNIFYKILMLELLGTIVDISWFFQGLEEFKKTVSRNLIVKLISLVNIFIFVKSENDLCAYFLIYVLSILLGNLSLWLFLPNFLERTKLSNLNILKHMKPTLLLFIPQVAIQIYTVLDRTMIGIIIFDKSEVGFYSQGEKIIKLLLTLITAMGTVMLPRIASRFAAGNHRSIKKYIYKSFHLVFLLSFPLMFGIISVSKSFVPVFFGSGYDKVVPIMIILSPILVFIGMSNVIGVQYLLPIKKQKQYTISVICGAITNFVVNLILIRKHGAVGAAIGTVFAELVVTMVQILYVKNNLDIKQIIKSTSQYLMAALVMFGVCLIIRYIIKNDYMSATLQVVIGSFVYFTMLLFMKNKFLVEYINLLYEKVGIKKRI